MMNDDGGATLSATVVNHLAGPLGIDRAVAGQKDDDEAPIMLVHGTRSDIEIQAGQTMRIGGIGDPFRLRLTDRVQVGSTLPVTLFFGRAPAMANGPAVTVLARVVPRDTRHDAVANNGPNREIAVHDPKIVVVPGQEKAYLGGWFESTIDDGAERRPVAADPGGRPLDVLHQTATGGPSGFFAQAGEKMIIGQSPYLDVEPHGDADYLRASDVRVGQVITVTFQFPSGDVIAKATVVQGRPDGTI
ncbi:MAG: hypothetical protein ABWY50_01135 [Aeromicrobium sp.]